MKRLAWIKNIKTTMKVSQMATAVITRRRSHLATRRAAIPPLRIMTPAALIRRHIMILVNVNRRAAMIPVVHIFIPRSLLNRSK